MRAGGVQLIVDAISAHDHDARLLHFAARVLAKVALALAGRATMQRVVADAEALPVILRACAARRALAPRQESPMPPCRRSWT